MQKYQKILFVLILLVVVIFYFSRPGTEDVNVLIPKGLNAWQIADILADSGVIRHKTVFIAIGKITGWEKRIKPGLYTFKRGESEFRVFHSLVVGSGIHELKVTIPEGKTLREIAEILGRTIGLDKERFLELTHDEKFIADLMANHHVKPPKSLEGYLFPDTYLFFYAESESAVIKRMVDRLFEVLDSNRIKRAKRLGLSVHQLLTLASIVEGEAAVDSERPIIAAVFWNRLRRRLPLESCATVEYVLPKRKARLTSEDLKIDSPYNTYIHRGLPPGPICSPGRASIDAVLNPARVRYLYFVSKGDGTHLFAETYAQHIRNKRRVARLIRAKSAKEPSIS